MQPDSSSVLNDASGTDVQVSTIPSTDWLMKTETRARPGRPPSPGRPVAELGPITKRIFESGV